MMGLLNIKSSEFQSFVAKRFVAYFSHEIVAIFFFQNQFLGEVLGSSIEEPQKKIGATLPYE